MAATTRLYLPDGGSFDLPVSGPVNRYVQTRDGVGAIEDCPVVVPVVIGALVGALATWFLVKVLK